MFEFIGRKIDEGIEKIMKLNRQRPWYKVYAHFFIIYKMKAKAFRDYEQFDRFMQIVLSNKQISKWQYDKLRAKYITKYGG